MSAPDLDGLQTVIFNALVASGDGWNNFAHHRKGETYRLRWSGPFTGPNRFREYTRERDEFLFKLEDSFRDFYGSVTFDADKLAQTIHSTVAAPLLARIAELEADIVDLEEDLMTAESRILCGSRSVDHAIQELQEARRYDLRRDGDA